MATDVYNEMWQFHFIFMKSIHVNFQLTYFFTSLQYFAQTWGDNVDHVFKKSTSGHWYVLQLLCSPSKQGELSENILQNLFHNLTPQTTVF